MDYWRKVVININPVAFSIFGLDIMWYGIFVTLGILLGIIANSSLIDGKHGLTKDNYFDLMIILIPVAVITTRLYYILFYDLEYYISNPGQIFNFRQGGLAIHGGILGGILVVAIYSYLKKINIFYLLDIMAPGLALGQAIGRWGNYANQEAHGGPTNLPWGIMVDGVKVHPTFLYESLVNICLFAFLYFYISKKKKFHGQIFAIYLIVYSTARFFIEGLRTDSLMLGDFRVAQLISIVGIIIGVVMFMILPKRTPVVKEKTKKIKK